MTDMPIVWRVEPGFSDGHVVPMNDAEFAQYETDQAAALATQTAAAAPKPPPAADAVLGALASLDPKTASIADVVNAVKSALAKAGAVPR